MKQGVCMVAGLSVPTLTLDTVVIGSGCAGFNAADCLYDLGRRNIALLTEDKNAGTSRNTGSDKQTYYKLSLAGEDADSVGAMAADLFAGEGVNGDTALAEAAGSVRAFIKLAELGVPFPTNEFGEYVGYQTDHDRRSRATSAGPLTSRYMTECLERAVEQKGIPVLEGMTAVKLLTKDGCIQGVLCLRQSQLSSPTCGLTIVRARQVVLATGGPAICYRDTVYPESQTGMSGMALEAGADGANLSEWQYGLASLKFRWNVSGTYQQVLPRYISVDRQGVEHEFLPDYFETPCAALDRVFLKGYQWPFDTTKIADSGSSLIDLLVYRETVERGRRVFLDFRTEPRGLEQGFDGLCRETLQYLRRSGACLPTPIQRLRRMNPQAIRLYREHGIDLEKEPLEIGICAQHHNGGLAVDAHWQTTLPGLYAVGEVAGTFGVHRPGGSALNATQVGSRRAAEHIACETTEETAVPENFWQQAAAETMILLRQLQAASAHGATLSTVLTQQRRAQESMSRCAAQLRDPAQIRELQIRLTGELARFYEQARVADARELPQLCKNRDMLITDLALLSAMLTAAEVTGSRGAALVRSETGKVMCDAYPSLRVAPLNQLTENLQLITKRSEDGFVSEYCPVRPVPQADRWFETAWAAYRKRNKRK